MEKREIERRADSTYCMCVPSSSSPRPRKLKLSLFSITTDHLTDMHTRAIGSSQMDTFGGYISQELVVLDKVRPHSLRSFPYH